MLSVQADLVSLIRNQEWRLNNLYWIKDDAGRVSRFRMKSEQVELYRHLHTRNAVLKARQLGISTFCAMLILDSALFCDFYKAGIIDFKKEGYEGKLNKIRYAFKMLDHVPEGATEAEKVIAAFGAELKRRKGKKKADGSYGFVVDRGKLLTLTNGSEIGGDTTYRGDTLQFLHVSELAKMARMFPLRAEEVVTGGFPAVQSEGGIIVVESTHEGGKHGQNYTLMNTAMENRSKKVLSGLDFKFFFFPWQNEKRYVSKLAEYHFKDSTLEYFAQMRERYGIEVSEAQMAFWESWEATLGFKIRQEYPMVPAEAFDAIGDNAIYGRLMMKLREQGRIGSRFVVDRFAPLYSSWDFGVADYTAVVFVQAIGGEHRVLGGYQAHRKDLPHFVQAIRDFEMEHNVKFYRHLLPHDAANNDAMMMTRERRLRDAGLEGLRIVPRCQSVWASINEVRSFLPSCVFHERCGDEMDNGSRSLLDCLENYCTDERSGEVKHDDCSHFADAFRMFVEACLAGFVQGSQTGVVGSGVSGKRKGGGTSRAIMC